MSYVFLLIFFFFAAAHFHLGGCQHDSFSNRRYKMFTFFFQRNWSPLFLHPSPQLRLSLLSTLMQTLKFSGEKESALLLLYFFSLKVRVAMRFTAETRVCLNFKISPGLHEWVLYVRGGSRIFFRRGCTRLWLYFNTNKPHSFFFAEYQLYQKTAGHLGRGEGAHPLHPPPRSASVRTDDFVRTRIITKFSYLQCSADWDKALIPNRPEHLPGDYGFVPSSN